MPSFEKSKSSGLWSVRFRDTVGGKTKNMRLSGYKTKKDAQYGYEDYIAERKACAEQAEKERAATPKLTFSELVEIYYAFKKSRIKESSYYNLTHKVNNKILPYFADIKIEDITPITILEWQNSLIEYSYSYQKDLRTHIAAIFNFAEKYHDIPNVVKKVDRPRNLEGKKEMLIYSPSEFERVIREVTRPEYNMLLTFLYASGCRRGEALALSWQDISFDKMQAVISKSISHKVGENGKPYRVTTPKNLGSNRTIALPQFIVARLKAYKEWQESTCKRREIKFIFGGDDPLPPTSIERALTKAAEKARVKRIRIHDLRHSCASYLIHKGVSIVAVSRHLGHKSVKQTLDTYSHLMPDDSDIIRNCLNDMTLNGDVPTN